MPLDLRNSTMAKAIHGLDFFAIQRRFSPRGAFCHIPLYMQCILHGLTTALLVSHSSLFTMKSVDCM